MNLDEINPVDKIKKGFNTFKNGFKGKSKEGFSNDELSTEENAYLSNIDKHPKFKVNNQLTDTVKVGYADLNGGAKVKITFSDINETNDDWDDEKMRTVSGLTITNPGTGSNYKAGDTIVITTDKIMKSDAPGSIKVATDDTDGNEENALRFTITDTSENDWGKFISELIGLFILLILFSIIGANIVHLSNLPMGALDTLLPSDWNSAPYRGEYLKGTSLFKKLNDSETREDLLEFLFPMKSVAFPYTYDSMYRNDELDDLGLIFYVIWPLKWLARTTAWAWSTGRLLIKYFIAVLKWIMTYIKSDSFTFFLGPFILMFALSTQLTTMIGFILMYIGGFMTDVKDGWVLAIFALVIFIIALGAALYYLCWCIKSSPPYIMQCLQFCCSLIFRCGKGTASAGLAGGRRAFGAAGAVGGAASRRFLKLIGRAQSQAAGAAAIDGKDAGERREIDENTKEIETQKTQVDLAAAAVPGTGPATSPPAPPPPAEPISEGAETVKAIARTPATMFESIKTQIGNVLDDLLSAGMGGFISNTVYTIIKVILGIIILVVAVFSIGFSSMYNTANGVFMTIQLTIFSLINLLFKNNGIALMKTEISKHIKGLTVIFILFSLAMARANLTTNIGNSYIFAGIFVIISIIFSMFKKDKE